MSNKNMQYILAGIFTAMALGLVIFLIYPLINDITRGSQEILSARANTVTTELQVRELESFQKKYKDYEPNFTKADAATVDAKDPINFIKFLEATAGASGVSTSIKLVPSGGEMLGNWQALTFDVLSNGSFAGMMLFAQKLETGPYVTLIQNVSLKKHEETIGSKIFAGPIDGDFLIQVATH